MLVHFYKYDGVTAYVETRIVKVGGSQENPILGKRESTLVAMCPGRKVGDKFTLRTNDGWSNPLFEIFEEGKAKQVFK